MKVEVLVAIELDIGDMNLDDDFWMQGLILDLKQDLAGFDWYIFEATEITPTVPRKEIP